MNTKKESMSKSVALENYLKIYFHKNQGVRVGESAVVSRRLHKKSSRLFPHIQILIEQDAGQFFCGCNEPNRAVHIDVYHEPATIDVFPLARRLWNTINTYLEHRDAPGISSSDFERLNKPSDVAARIWVATYEAQGSILRLLGQGYDDYKEIPEDLIDHVHVIMELPEDWYGLILGLVETVEDTILEQGCQNQKVMGITHGFEKGVQMEPFFNLSFPFFPSLKKSNDIIRIQNQKQAIMAMARRLGSVEEVEDFLNSMSGNIFQRLTHRPHYRKKDDLDYLVNQLTEAGLVEKKLLGPKLTEEGEEVLRYLVINQQEMEALYRSIMRQAPRGAKRYQRFAYNQLDSRGIEKINRHRILSWNDPNASNVLAVPETVVEAAKNSYQNKLDHIKISKDDIRVFGKKSYVPIDICLLVDCSASMIGDKSQAAWQLGEYLLLTSKERVAVVIFQEMEGRVAVPFTRNQKRLQSGLRSIGPDGMTPLASGIVKSLELIQESKVRNPLLVLITDGMPTYPLWTYDSKADALRAARMLVDAKIRLVCIGVRSNREFLKELATAARGTLYVVDNLNRDTLIEVMHEEREIISG